MSTTPTRNIVPGRIVGHSNVIINGYRYTNDRKRGNKTYMKCILYSNGCRACITLMDGELTTPVPDHPTHDVQHSGTYVHVSHSRWNQNDATALLLPRSSNIAEGWHHGFNSMMSCSNPSIWKFLQCLKNEQNITDVEMTKLMMRE